MLQLVQKHCNAETDVRLSFKQYLSILLQSKLDMHKSHSSNLCCKYMHWSDIARTCVKDDKISGKKMPIKMKRN